MARFSITADVSLRRQKNGEGGTPDVPKVLELRVHGVNNTTAAALLDVKAEEVEEVTGDKLGSFWRPTEAATAARGPGERGYVPGWAMREAYSWGGMVRTTPDLGSTSAADTVPAAIARVFYALILPFSIANAAQWSRLLDTGGASWPRRAWIALTAAASRLFSLVLTLMYTVTAATLALDLGAAQCAATPARCGPLEGVLASFPEWTPGQRIAVFALGPIVAVAVLWIISSISSLRYDVLSGVKGAESTMASGAAVPALAQAGFWSNRITRDLARAHVAAAMLVTVMLALRQVDGLWSSGGAVGAWADAASMVTLILFIGTVLLTAVMPTGSLVAEDDSRKKLVHLLSGLTLGLAIAVTAAGLILVAFAPAGEVAADAGTGWVFVLLVSVGGVIALSGIAWRLFGGVLRTAWLSAGPFVLMTLALALASAISAIVVVGVRNVIQTKPVAAVPGEPAPVAVEPLLIPDAYPALGGTILLAVLIAAVLIGLALIVPKRMTERAVAWGQASAAAELDIPDGGVLPPSPAAIFGRISGKRSSAGRLHVVEPMVGVLAILLALGLAAGVRWAQAADGGALWEVAGIPWLETEASRQAIQTYVGIAAPALGWLGAVIVALLVSGAATGGQRPLGIVWDIACFLPRTGHPFGPPCYAERAVPEIAGRLFDWLSRDESRRAVLSAHSMGAVLSVSALGLLASKSTTSGVLDRVSLLTFGIQLRSYFGRMLPDLLGPEILGVAPSRPPGLLAVDPWKHDFRSERRPLPQPPEAPADSMAGSLLIGRSVRWVNLWRLTDYLGFPGMSTARTAVVVGSDGAEVVRENLVDRCAEELDSSGYMAEVGTHGEYYRVPAYASALEDLVPATMRIVAPPPPAA